MQTNTNTTQITNQAFFSGFDADSDDDMFDLLEPIDNIPSIAMPALVK